MVNNHLDYEIKSNGINYSTNPPNPLTNPIIPSPRPMTAQPYQSPYPNPSSLYSNQLQPSHQFPSNQPNSINSNQFKVEPSRINPTPSSSSSSIPIPTHQEIPDYNTHHLSTRRPVSMEVIYSF